MSAPTRSLCFVTWQRQLLHRLRRSGYKASPIFVRLFSNHHVSRNILKLHQRGVFQNVFPEESSADLLHKLEGSPQGMYCGFDPTADSLHIGNLLAIIALLHCQRAGHKPIAVIGGATALIGDPSGRTSERQPMKALEVEKNVISITASLNRIITNHQQFIWKNTSQEVEPIKILNNAEWYQDMNVVEFLSTFGRHFRMGQMLRRHSVASRLESPDGMNFTEFTYQIFQSYDWYHLLRSYDCILQIGGNDQTGNIVAGYDFISKLTNHRVFGLTVPLVTTISGSKLGKSVGNAVWLNADKTSPFQLYQYFLNVPDSEVETYFKLFTFLSDNDISDKMRKHMGNPENRLAQITVAEQVTLLVHGEAGVYAAKRWTNALFGDKAEALALLSQSELCQLFENAPTTELLFEHGMTVLEVCMKVNCFDREVDGRRMIGEGGLYVNQRRVTQPDFVLVPGEHILSNDITLLRVGKKQYYVVKWHV